MKHLLKIFFCFAVAVAAMACGNSRNAANGAETDSVITEAKGIAITRCDGYTVVRIANPWQEGQLLQTYVLVPRGKDMPESVPEGTVVRVPLERAVVYSSVHAGVMKELGCFDAVRGVCDAQYYTMPEVRQGLADGSIADIGNSLSPTIERLVAMKPDAIILSPFQNAGYGVLTNLGVPIIECADYMEHSPMGRAEWIKLFGELLCKCELADSIYLATAERYSKLCELTANVQKRPKVISETVTSGVWYVPGGDSYMAHLFNDAGAFYPWSDNSSAGSLSLDFSQVLDTAQDADYWLIKPGSTLSYSDFEAQNPLNAKFRAFSERHIFQCNTAETSLFTDFPFHPDVLLSDFVAIFHPELLPGYSTKYYKPLIEK